MQKIETPYASKGQELELQIAKALGFEIKTVTEWVEVEKMKEAKYWNLANSEIPLSYNIDDAVEAALLEAKEYKKEISETLSIAGYKLKKVDVKSSAEEQLRELLSGLDYNFKDLDNEGFTEPTDRMKEAALRFVKEVLKDYEITTFEQVCIKEVNIKLWIKRHPDWDK